MINKENTFRPRGRPRSFDRNIVLERAMQTFWGLGYEGASIADLTTAMKITPQSLYAAFGSKSALYREALAFYQVTVGAFAARALTEEPTAVAAFDRMLQESAKEFCKPGRPRGCMVSTAVLTCASENQDEARHVAQLRNAAVGAFQQRIERAICDGEMGPDTNSATLARYLAAVVQGMSVQAQDGASKSELMDIARMASLVLKQHQFKKQS